MSVAGIDLGTSAAVIASLKKGAVGIIRNEVSDRLTPCVVGFTDAERLVGDAAVAQIRSNIKNTCRHMKQLLGRSVDDPVVEEERNYELASIEQAEDGLAGYAVTSQGEKKVFTASRILAVLLNRLKQIAAMDAGGVTVKDVVIGVPGWYTDRQRREVMNAARIAGLNVLRLLNEHTATALDYGIYRSHEFRDNEPSIVAFACMGHGTTYVTIVEFLKGRLRVLAEASDPFLGGRQFDRVIADHFAAPLKAKGIDVMSNKKARLKMEEQAAKTKKVLSANQEAQFNVECVMDDEDVAGMMTREEFEGLCRPKFGPRLAKLCERALSIAKLTSEQIATVEIAGGACRIPWVQEVLKESFNKEELSRTLNADETVARGCTLMAARLSPNYKVRQFDVVDSSFLPIVMEYPAEPSTGSTSSSSSKSTVLFQEGCPLGSLKSIKFKKSGPFEIHFAYGDTENLPEGTPKDLGSYQIALPVTEDKNVVKISARLDYDGIFALDSATLIQEIPAAPLAPVVDDETGGEETARMNDEENLQNGGEGEGAGAGDTDDSKKAEKMVDENEVPVHVEKGTASSSLPIDTPPPPSPSAPQPPPPPSKPSVTTKRTPISFTQQARSHVVSEAFIQKYEKEEIDMRAADRECLETKASFNDLESAIYRFREKLQVAYHQYVPASKVSELEKSLEDAESWLFDNLNSAKSAAMEKLQSVMDLFSPLQTLHDEQENRPSLVTSAQDEISLLRSSASSPDPSRAHIPDDKKQAIIAKCDEVEKWLNDKMNQQRSLSPQDTPVVYCKDIKAKVKELQDFASPILNTPKPKPPPPQPAAASGKEGGGQSGQDAESTNPSPESATFGDIPVQEDDAMEASEDPIPPPTAM